MAEPEDPAGVVHVVQVVAEVIQEDQQRVAVVQRKVVAEDLILLEQDPMKLLQITIMGMYKLLLLI